MQVGSRPRQPRRGSVSVVAIFAVILIAGMSVGMLTLTMGSRRERASTEYIQRALYAADAGVASAIANLGAGVTTNIGSPASPVQFSGGAYSATIVADVDETYVVISTGTYNGERVTIEAVAAPVGGGVYFNGVFAGNKSGDPLYSLAFNGTGGQADEIFGDVYSGGDVTVAEDAVINGAARAGGVVSGMSGEGGVKQPTPDLQAMDYENTADVKVAARFSGATYQSDDAGGSAWQLPQADPAHIFRMNPSDRATEINSTVKNDYFLEDPYAPVRSDPNQNGTDAFQIRLSDNNDPALDGNQKVYFIDGNLWLHNRHSYSFKIFDNSPGGVQVCFVVRGNIYFSDNLFYQNQVMDGVAFIAMEDPNVADSGNIFFGDPEFGTLLEMNGFMYAENDFYDINLDATGSAQVRVNGNMSAGDQVLIQRDYQDRHTKLTVDFDDRIMNGDIVVPGVPIPTNAATGRYQMITWRRVANP